MTEALDFQVNIEYRPAPQRGQNSEPDKLWFEFTYTNRGDTPMVLNMYRYPDDTQVMSFGPKENVESVRTTQSPYGRPRFRPMTSEDVVRLAPGARHVTRFQHPLRAAFPFWTFEGGIWTLFTMKSAGPYKVELCTHFKSDDALKPFLKTSESLWEGKVCSLETTFTLPVTPKADEK